MATDFATAIANLKSEVARNKTVDGSAKVLLAFYAAQIEEHKNEPEAIQALADEMRAANDELADAVAKGTPAEPDPDDPPTT